MMMTNEELEHLNNYCDRLWAAMTRKGATRKEQRELGRLWQEANGRAVGMGR